MRTDEALPPRPNLPETGQESHPTGPPATVLACLQDQLLGRPAEAGKLPQDRSLQIVGCPGVWREVETVHASIVDQLDRDPELRQTDIAVFVADMDAYRPALRSVFERPPRLLAYNLGDYTADRLSVFGQGLLDLCDLALESFTRSRVFEVLLNPCFLARLGVSRSDAAHWLDWADELGIRHGWDAQEKQAQGLYRSGHYSWKLGLQRLRLGRYMRVVDDDVPASPWRSIIPFADVESADRDKLDAFCRAVEGLLPALSRLRHFRGSAHAWADAIRHLIHRYLKVPDDRLAEESVRESIFAALDRFELWDELHERSTLPLSLVREYLAVAGPRPRRPAQRPARRRRHHRRAPAATADPVPARLSRRHGGGSLSRQPVPVAARSPLRAATAGRHSAGRASALRTSRNDPGDAAPARHHLQRARSAARPGTPARGAGAAAQTLPREERGRGAVPGRLGVPVAARHGVPGRSRRRGRTRSCRSAPPIGCWRWRRPTARSGCGPAICTIAARSTSSIGRWRRASMSRRPRSTSSGSGTCRSGICRSSSRTRHRRRSSGGSGSTRARTRTGPITSRSSRRNGSPRG